jgi:hypothetical protein
MAGGARTSVTRTVEMEVLLKRLVAKLHETISLAKRSNLSSGDKSVHH